MKKTIISIILSLSILSAIFFTGISIVAAQDDKSPTETPAPKVTASPKASPLPTPDINKDARSEKLIAVLDSMSQLRAYIEFFFLELGDYPEDLPTLEKGLNSILPKNLEKIKIPVEPETGKGFIYTRSKNGKS